MTKFLLAAALLVTSSFTPLAANAQGDDPAMGYWLTENKRAVIHMEPCDQYLCGSIYWIIEGGMEFDEKNPIPELRKRKLCGLDVVTDLEYEGTGEWEDGHIYKADDGDVYSADINMQEDGTLKVRGYVGMSFLGKTQIWNRVNAADYEQCS